jgi:hypothetical protein
VDVFDGLLGCRAAGAARYLIAQGAVISNEQFINFIVLRPLLMLARRAGRIDYNTRLLRRMAIRC